MSTIDQADEIARKIVAGSHVEFAEHYASELIDAIAAALRSYADDKLKHAASVLLAADGDMDLTPSEAAEFVRSLISKPKNKSEPQA